VYTGVARGGRYRGIQVPPPRARIPSKFAEFAGLTSSPYITLHQKCTRICHFHTKHSNISQPFQHVKPENETTLLNASLASGYIHDPWLWNQVNSSSCWDPAFRIQKWSQTEIATVYPATVSECAVLLLRLITIYDWTNTVLRMLRSPVLAV